MADNDNLHPVTHLRPVRTPPSRIRTLWSSLSDAMRAVILLAGFVGLIIGAYATLSSVVTAGELATAARAQDAVDTKQNAEIDEMDEDLDLLHLTTVKLATDADWLKREVAGVREDLRRMDRGLPLAPLPLPTPHPMPVQTSAQPAPTRAP